MIGRWQAESALEAASRALQEAQRQLSAAQRALAAPDEEGQAIIPIPAGCTMRQAQRLLVQHAIVQEGAKARAARKLGISRRSVYYLLRCRSGEGEP